MDSVAALLDTITKITIARAAAGGKIGKVCYFCKQRLYVFNAQNVVDDSQYFTVVLPVLSVVSRY